MVVNLCHHRFLSYLNYSLPLLLPHLLRDVLLVSSFLPTYLSDPDAVALRGKRQVSWMSSLTLFKYHDQNEPFAMVQWPVGPWAYLNICNIKMTVHIFTFMAISTPWRKFISWLEIFLYLLGTGVSFCSGWLGTRGYSDTLYWSFYWTSGSFEDCIMLPCYTVTESTGDSLWPAFFSCLSQIYPSASVICMNRISLDYNLVLWY